MSTALNRWALDRLAPTLNLERSTTMPDLTEAVNDIVEHVRIVEQGSTVLKLLGFSFEILNGIGKQHAGLEPELISIFHGLKQAMEGIESVVLVHGEQLRIKNGIES